MTNRKRTVTGGVEIGQQPRHTGVRETGDATHRIGAVTPPRPGEKRFADMTFTEKWLLRRDRFLRVLPGRLSGIDERMQLLIKVGDAETYEFTDKEAELLVARLRAWVNAVEVSFQRRKPFQPSDLPTVLLDRDLAPPADALPPPAGLEGIW